jgi:hypothetical protein
MSDRIWTEIDFKNYSKVKSLHLSWPKPDEQPSVYNLEIILLDGGGDEIGIRFEGLSDFKLDEIHPDLHIWLNIIDLRPDQLEGLNYRVEELNDHYLKFYCKNLILI